MYISKEKKQLIVVELEDKFEPIVENDRMDLGQTAELNNSADKLINDLPIINADLLNDVFK